MLPRIRERIANEVRQGGGNPFNHINVQNNNIDNRIDNNDDRVRRRQQQQQQQQNNNAADNQANPAGVMENPTFVRPFDLYLGCSTRVRRELLRINEWDRMGALKDVWTKQVVEAPHAPENDPENDVDAAPNDNNERRPAGAVLQAQIPGNNLNANLHLRNVNLQRLLNNRIRQNADNRNAIIERIGLLGASNRNEDSDQDIREIMHNNIKKHRFRPAYYKIQFLNPTYSVNLDLLKLFHTRNIGNPKLAAQQFCRYWDVKLQYFGLEHLCKPLSLKGLSAQDKACLHNGCMQLFRDDHGRIVLCLLPSLLSVAQANGVPNNNNKTTKPMTTDGNTVDQNGDEEDDDGNNKLVCQHLVRALWYLLFRALQDKTEIDMVILLLGQDKDDLFGKTILHCTSILREALPFNVVALHYLDGPGMTMLEEEETNTSNHGSIGGGHNHDFLWGLPQAENNDANAADDVVGFGGLDQVAEWGGAVQVQDHQMPQDNLLIQHQNQDEHQQRRFFAKSKATLEHLEDRVGRNVRLRLRFHNLFQLQQDEEEQRRITATDDGDTIMENFTNKDPFAIIRNRLAKFGISNLPLNDDGTLIMHNPIDSSSKRFFFSRPEATLSNNLILPTPKDVLLGKGRPYQEHPGNIAMNDVVDEYRPGYAACKSRSEKTATSEAIMEIVKRRGGRFLVKKSKDDDLWAVAADSKARDKIAHSFRMPRKQVKEAMKEKRQREQQQQQQHQLQESHQGQSIGTMLLNPPANVVLPPAAQPAPLPPLHNIQQQSQRSQGMDGLSNHAEV